MKSQTTTGTKNTCTDTVAGFARSGIGSDSLTPHKNPAPFEQQANRELGWFNSVSMHFSTGKEAQLHRLDVLTA